MRSSVIVLGSDPSVLKIGHGASIDPSGFLHCGFNSVAQKKVLTAAQDAWFAVLRSIPSHIHMPLPLAIPLYMEPLHNPEAFPKGAVSYRFDRSRALLHKERERNGWHIAIQKYPLPEIRGIVLALKPETLSDYLDDVYATLVHEICHVLTQSAFSASHTIAEACTERITLEIVPRQQSREFHHLPWIPHLFTRTCGLKIDDFASVEGTTTFRDLSRIYALNEMKDLSCDEIWTVTELLLRDAHKSRFCPTSIDIFTALHKSIGNARMEHLIGSALIGPLTEGKQCFLCPFGDEIFAFCVSVEHNEEYLHAPLEEVLAWDKCQFRIRDSYTQLTLSVVYANGEKIVIDSDLKGEGQYSLASIQALICDAGCTLPTSEPVLMQFECLGAKTSIKVPPEK